MTGRQRILAAFSGQQPDRTPVLLHNFMMAAAEAGVSMARFRSDARAAADALVQSLERYGHDGVIVDIDTVTLAEALGTPADHPEDVPARAAGARLERLEDVRRLPPPDIDRSERIRHWLEVARLVRERAGDEFLVRGNCDQAPYSLAALLRGPEAWMLDLMDPAMEPYAHALLEYALQATCRFLDLMAETGVDMLSNGDSLAGSDVISPRLYRRFAQPYERRVAEHAHALRLPYVLHICGRTDPILPDMIATGADGLELDSKTDDRLANTLMYGKTVFIGNIDPAELLANGAPAQVRAATTRLISVFRGNPRFVLNSGCAIPSTAPPENISAFVKAVK